MCEGCYSHACRRFACVAFDVSVSRSREFVCRTGLSYFFFFNDTATPEIYPLSLHDALPISHHPEIGTRSSLENGRIGGAHGHSRSRDQRGSLSLRPSKGNRCQVAASFWTRAAGSRCSMRTMLCIDLPPNAGKSMQSEIRGFFSPTGSSLKQATDWPGQRPERVFPKACDG